MVDAEGFDPNRGWWYTFNSPGTAAIQYSPHYESYIWAVYLWAYAQCGFAPLLERAQAGLSTMMRNYPTKWVPTMNGIAMQRARILLPLAFLVRVNDTRLHRGWLTEAVDGLLTRQHCEADWCALREELSHPGWGGATSVPLSNEEYGDGEAPLNQENEDPVSDFLYTSNFALLGLHEAAAALGGNATVKRAEDALANFIVRSQARAETNVEPIPVIGCIARGDERLNCAMCDSLEAAQRQPARQSSQNPSPFYFPLSITAAYTFWVTPR